MGFSHACSISWGKLLVILIAFPFMQLFRVEIGQLFLQEIGYIGHRAVQLDRGLSGLDLDATLLDKKARA